MDFHKFPTLKDRTSSHTTNLFIGDTMQATQRVPSGSWRRNSLAMGDGDRRETNCQWLTLCARRIEWQEESSKERQKKKRRRMKMSIIIFQWGKQNMKMLIHTNQIRFHCGKDGEQETSGGERSFCRAGGSLSEWRHPGSTSGAITYKSREIKLLKDDFIVLTRNWLIQASSLATIPIRRRSSVRGKCP